MEEKDDKTEAEKERERISEAVRSIMEAVMRGQGEPHRASSVERKSPLKTEKKETSDEAGCSSAISPTEEPTPSQSSPGDFLNEILEKRSTFRKIPKLGSTSSDSKVEDLKKDTLWSELKIAVEKRRKVIEGEVEPEDSTNVFDEVDEDETDQ